MNYNIPFMETDMKTNIDAYSEKGVEINTLETPSNMENLFELSSIGIWRPNRYIDFVKPYGAVGTVDFPQVSLQCPAADILKMNGNFVESGIGGSPFFNLSWKLVLLLNELRHGSPAKEMRRYAALYYKILRKRGVFQHCAKSITAYALLSTKNWAPYVWMVKMSHELELIEKLHNIKYLIPLCLPYGTGRFIPRYNDFRLQLKSLPDSVVDQPTIMILSNKNTLPRYQEQIVNLFYPTGPINNVLEKGKKEIRIDPGFNHAGYCLLINITPATNIDYISLQLASKQTDYQTIDAISGPLCSIPGCNGWYSVTTDPKITVLDAINMKTVPGKDVKYLNFDAVEYQQVVLSNSKNLDISLIETSNENEIVVEMYWQYQNIIIDTGDQSGLAYC